jgi:hypothetical protein
MADALVTSTPNASYDEIALALVRGVVQIASGFGFTWALTVSGSQETMIATGLVMIATLVWSTWQKISAARAAHAGSVASAKAGTALKTS